VVQWDTNENGVRKKYLSREEKGVSKMIYEKPETEIGQPTLATTLEGKQKLTRS